MRIIYYVPEGESIDDYKSEWDQVVAEVHVGLSPNIEDYINFYEYNKGMGFIYIYHIR